MRIPIVPAITTLLLLSNCGEPVKTADVGQGGPESSGHPPPLFVTVDPDSSRIHFANTVSENSLQNYYVYEYMYNGGGVAIGDLNNDGLADIYFTGNLVDDKLYLNRGHLRFDDVTTTAIPGEHEGWHSGVTMADVNNDGLLDIYVCRAGWWNDPAMRTNLFYQNMGAGPDGVPVFSERAAELGIADTTRSTQAAFFDHDLDGDLDLFVMNCPLQSGRTLNNIEVEDLVRKHKSPSSRLYRNDGGHFNDITAQAGLWSMGYGLGLAISDLNGDGAQDIYVANDYIEPDKMFINDGRGHYRDEIHERTRHISNYGMGCDAADYDNDGLVDIVVLDMVSEDHTRSKKNMGAMSPEKFWTTVAAGYQLQYMFNTLQHNNGNGTFSEIGQLAGMSKTDWSWAPLFADLDNDGWKDLLITNGYKRDMRDNDFNIAATKLKAGGQPVDFNELLRLIPTNKIRDYLYRNNGDLTFSDVSEQWGFTKLENSNGAAYADLDNDGDLDVVVSNMEEPASLFENTAVQQGMGNWLRLKLEGAGTALAMGSRATVRTGPLQQTQELMLTRGYQSSVEPVLHFGLGSATTVDEVRVTWPDGLASVITNVQAGQVLTVPHSSAMPVHKEAKPEPLFAETAAALGLDFRHVEDPYDDFRQEVLLPHKQSENGPMLGVGDANGDGREDLFVGGARGQAGTLYVQRENGTFARSSSQPWSQHKLSEDMGSLFFDADGDGDQDLYVVSGSNETDLPFEAYSNRIYFNDGKGGFGYDSDALPLLETSALRPTAGDMDGDGDLDIFIGGRITPGQYPRAPRSYLLLNNGHGHFSDGTSELAPSLLYPGLVTDAEFLDYDGDRDLDLLMVGEWMPISFYQNDGGHFTPANDKSGLSQTEGWWWSLTSGDIDGDGDPDLVCGNIGWNNKFHCSPEHPFHLYWSDFDDNGHADIVLARENEKLGLVPVRGRECSSQQCAMIKDKFPTYDAFANASLQQIYTPEKLGQALHLQAKHMRSCVLINQGDGRFVLRDLPEIAQAAPIMGSVLFDANGDGKQDLIVAGNHWGAEVETVRYDGGTGLVLLGDGQGGFAPMTIAQSGFFAWGNAKDVALLHTGSGKEPMIVVANNNERLQAFAPLKRDSRLSQR